MARMAGALHLCSLARFAEHGEKLWTTPELWNSLQLNIKPKADLPVHNVTVLVDEWLGRPMGHPLDISVVYDIGDQTAIALNGAAAPAVIDVIARYSRQWQKIKPQLPGMIP
jgi:hypothetical protein